MAGLIKRRLIDWLIDTKEDHYHYLYYCFQAFRKLNSLLITREKRWCCSNVYRVNPTSAEQSQCITSTPSMTEPVRRKEGWGGGGGLWNDRGSCGGEGVNGGKDDYCWWELLRTADAVSAAFLSDRSSFVLTRRFLALITRRPRGVFITRQVSLGGQPTRTVSRPTSINSAMIRTEFLVRCWLLRCGGIDTPGPVSTGMGDRGVRIILV